MEMLAVRTLMMATNQGKSLNDLFGDSVFGKPLPFPVPSELLDLEEPYLSEEYSSVHKLEDNFLKRSVSNLFKRLINVAIMVHVLKRSSFFDYVQRNESVNSHRSLWNMFRRHRYLNSVLIFKLPKLEMFCGSLLMKYLCVIFCNAHEISEIVEERFKPQSKMSEMNLEIGAALYPLLSLINHACDPNVVRHNYGKNVVLRSIQVIECGQQVSPFK